MSRARSVLLLACLWLLPATLFAAGIPIRGQVLDAGGAPLAKAKVRLVPLASAYEAGRLELNGKEPEAVASAESGADGSFLLQAPEAGMWKVVVGAGDGKLVPQEALAAPLLEELDLPAVRLRRGAGPAGLPSLVWHEAPRAPRERPGSGSTVPLQVLDARGKPAAGVLVLEAPSELEETAGPLGLTGENGLVELAAPKEGPLDVVLLAADGRQLETQVRPLPAKAPRTPQEARLPALVEFPVQVTSAADGRPLGGALVWPSGDPGSFRRTDARGAARLAGGPGASDGTKTLLVEAAAPGFLPGLRERRLKTAGQSPLSVSLQPDLALAGVVVTETGAPVAGAEISFVMPDMGGLMGADQSWLVAQLGALVRSGPEGRFRWRGLAPDIEVELRVAKDGFAPTRIPVTAPRPDRPAAPLRIVLRRGASAFGRILGPGDQPIAGAQVTLETARSGGSEEMMFLSILQPGLQDTFEAVTGADGRFDLSHLPAGRYDLSARGRGWAPLTVPGLEIPDTVSEKSGATDLGTLVLSHGVALEGKVVDTAGKPVQGAEIRLQEDGEEVLARLTEDRREPDAVSGPDGFFRIEDLRGGSTVDLAAERQGYAPGSVTGARVPAEPLLRITLQAVGAVSGRVVDPDGRPVAGAIVQVEGRPWSLGGSLTVGREPRLDQTDAEGSFRITEVIPGPVSVSAQASGWQDGTVAEMELRAGEEKRGLEIVLAPAAILEGQVLSSSGRPILGAEVKLSSEDHEGGVEVTLTDADGRYVLDNLPPGLHTMEASHADHGMARRQIELHVGESSLDFTLEGEREISGRVVDNTGAPVTGVQIFLMSETAPFLMGRSRSDGSFRFSAVEDGSYRAMVSKDGFVAPEVPPIVVDGSSVTGLEIQLGRGGAITGRIAGVEVADLARVQISALGHDGPGGRITVDGTYRIDHLAEGDWVVRAELPGTRLYAEGAVLLEPGASEARLDLEMQRGLVLSGRVRRNGAPAVGETVFLSPGSLRTHVETDAEGRFRFEGLSTGTHHLRIGGSLGGPVREETIDLQADREITIDLSTALE